MSSLEENKALVRWFYEKIDKGNIGAAVIRHFAISKISPEGSTKPITRHWVRRRGFSKALV